MITLFNSHKIKSKFQTKANFVRGLGYIEYNVQKVPIFHVYLFICMFMDTFLYPQNFI